MQLPYDNSDRHLDLDAELKQSAQEILDGLDSSGDTIRKSSGDKLYFDATSEQIYLLTEGEIRFEYAEQHLITLDAGDIVGLSRPLNFAAVTMICTSPVCLQPFNREQLIKHACKSEEGQLRWSQYLTELGSVFLEQMSHLPAKRSINKGFLRYSKGDVIINQGAKSDYVYTMLEGSANVYQDDVQVGRIGSQEIFGAMASFIGHERSASVIAAEPCTVIAVPESQFQLLITEQPELSYSLLKTMANTIKKLNGMLIELQKD